jgi:hypothetical protein
VSGQRGGSQRETNPHRFDARDAGRLLAVAKGMAAELRRSFPPPLESGAPTHAWGAAQDLEEAVVPELEMLEEELRKREG